MEVAARTLIRARQAVVCRAHAPTSPDAAPAAREAGTVDVEVPAWRCCVGDVLTFVEVVLTLWVDVHAPPSAAPSPAMPMPTRPAPPSSSCKIVVPSPDAWD